MTVAARLDPTIILDTLTGASDGLTVQQVTDALTQRMREPIAQHEVTQALRDLHARGQISRSKGLRSETLYTPATQEAEDPRERLAREKHELQQALAILTGAAARTVAQADPHDRRHGTLKELADATDAARATLDATRS